MRRTLLLTALAAVAAVPAAAALELAGAVEAAAPRAVELRHAIHANPELSNREHETAALVADELRRLGLEVETGIAHTGVVGVLRGGQPGPVVAVRADMDALPVTEATDLPFRSTKRATLADGQEVGVAHACGHDVHTAVGLGTAAALAALRQELPGTVMFVFQPAEEGPPAGEQGGAPLMLAEGVFDRLAPAAIFALHSQPALEVGQVGVKPGPVWAAVDKFTIELVGKQAHGAWPHDSVDPIVMAAEAVLALQTIRSRNLDPSEPSVVTVGMVHGGERFNIIPGKVLLEGTVRTYSQAVQDQVEARMRRILEGVALAHGGGYALEYERVTPATVNAEALHGPSRASLVAVFGEEGVVPYPAVMGGEDFAFFAERVPGYYFHLGTTEPGGASGGLHTPDFRAADAAVPAGIAAMTRLVVDFLARQ